MDKRTKSRLLKATVLDETVAILDYRTFERDWYGGPGPYNHDLLCSALSCTEVMVAGWTFDSAQRQFANRKVAVGKCLKGHHSILPSHVVSAEPPKPVTE